MMARMQCSECGADAAALAWRCEACGGPLDLTGLPPFDAAQIARGDFSLWRYAAMLPVDKRFSLGEGMTPLVTAALDGCRFHAKLEYLNPTGSYKDRGTTTLINYIAGFEVDEVIDNSSGNAGASLAAFARAADMSATVFVPAATAKARKKALIRAFGGRIIESQRPTEDVYAAAEETTYASHAWNPYFVLGQMTAAWEIWEQLGGRLPEAIVAPVGHGGLFLGFYRGCQALLDAGLSDRMPRMIAIQSTGVDPIVRGWEQGSESPAAINPQTSIADGILVDVPVRGRQILAALYETDGSAFRVEDETIERAQKRMAAQGLLIEATSAVTAAALPQIRERFGDETELVLALTGSGLKNIG